jgi:hypothetical protein
MDDTDPRLRNLARSKRAADQAAQRYEAELVATYDAGATLAQVRTIDGYGTDEGMAKRLRRLGATIRARGRQKV